MVDSVAIFPPGYRLTDSDTGAPISGATIEFYDAGTVNPKTTYADRNLSTALGTSVTTDSLGRPTSDGTTPTDIFVDTSDFKVVIKDGSGVTLETKDNRPGAPVSASAEDVSVTASFPVVTKSLDYTVVVADQNTSFAGNCSSASFTFTLPSAVTAGNGWKIKIQHAGSANVVKIATVSSQTISEGSKSYGTQFVLVLNGEEIELTSDGGNWRITMHATPFIKIAQGIIPITDRLSTPGSPSAGQLFLLTGTGGAWSGFAAGDIALYTGVGWVNFTPYTDCGWVAFVQDENLYYEFQDSAWVAQTATTSFAGRVKVSQQSSMETATATDTAVLIGHQQFHPGHPKAWGNATVSGGTPTLRASYNMTSITDSAVGQITFTIGTAFSSAHWAVLSNAGENVSGMRPTKSHENSQFAGSCIIDCDDSGSSLADPLSWHMVGFGDQ